MTTPRLDREEYIEQAYLFRTFRERLDDSTPAQEVLGGIREEILATTRLPMAIDFLYGEMQLNGRLGGGMARLEHYFTKFQAFVVDRAEEDEAKFDFRTALLVLELEAEYRASEEATPAGLFAYQFECLARNRLGYDRGMEAMAADPVYPEAWREWILKIRFHLGTVDFADMIYMRSSHHVEEVRRRSRNDAYEPSYPILFGAPEGRIAKANRGRDPLYMFAALQRHLNYPSVPRPPKRRSSKVFDPPLEQRFQRLEGRIALLEQEQKGGLDLSQFYKSE